MQVVKLSVLYLEALIFGTQKPCRVSVNVLYPGYKNGTDTCLLVFSAR